MNKINLNNPLILFYFIKKLTFIYLEYLALRKVRPQYEYGYINEHQI